ncbi:MAG: hypothetical protein QM598_08525 [Protaetiibacter sp.]
MGTGRAPRPPGALLLRTLALGLLLGLPTSLLVAVVALGPVVLIGGALRGDLGRLVLLPLALGALAIVLDVALEVSTIFWVERVRYRLRRRETALAQQTGEPVRLESERLSWKVVDRFGSVDVVTDRLAGELAPAVASGWPRVSPRRGLAPVSRIRTGPAAAILRIPRLRRSAFSLGLVALGLLVLLICALVR